MILPSPASPETLNRATFACRLDDRQRGSDLAVQEAQLAEMEATLARWEQLPRPEDVRPAKRA